MYHRKLRFGLMSSSECGVPTIVLKRASHLISFIVGCEEEAEEEEEEEMRFFRECSRVNSS